MKLFCSVETWFWLLKITRLQPSSCPQRRTPCSRWDSFVLTTSEWFKKISSCRFVFGQWKTKTIESLKTMVLKVRFWTFREYNSGTVTKPYIFSRFSNRPCFVLSKYFSCFGHHHLPNIVVVCFRDLALITQCFVHHRNWTAARRDFTQLLQQDPEDSRAYTYRARAHAKTVCNIVLRYSFSHILWKLC